MSRMPGVGLNIEALFRGLYQKTKFRHIYQKLILIRFVYYSLFFTAISLIHIVKNQWYLHGINSK
jgi:hypothetical protein